MNGATRDVTIISTASFEKVAYIPSGEGPMGVATYEQSKYIFSFAINQVNVIDPATDEVRIKLEKGQLVGANGDTDKIYFATEEGLKALRISDLEQVDLLKGQSGIYLVLAPGKDSQALY